VLGDAIDQLRNSPGTLGSSQARLEAVAGRMRSALADVGTRVNRVETAAENLAGSTLDATNALSQIENVDIASAIVDLQMQEVAYQASLGATARVMQPSLIDFLR
jgi:flagellar hook-associated protein 3 FlgL